MADVLFVAILLAFFGIAYVLVQACERIIGRDEAVVAVSGEQERIAA